MNMRLLGLVPKLMFRKFTQKCTEASYRTSMLGEDPRKTSLEDSCHQDRPGRTATRLLSNPRIHILGLMVNRS